VLLVFFFANAVYFGVLRFHTDYFEMRRCSKSNESFSCEVRVFSGTILAKWTNATRKLWWMTRHKEKELNKKRYALAFFFFFEF
jgi:hypothetical protein